jgi:hypothetical protein
VAAKAGGGASERSLFRHCFNVRVELIGFKDQK